jgi:hypothetical protein
MPLDCPLDCPYLLESRKHDRPEPANLRKFPNQDIRFTETFLRDHEPLLIALGKAVLAAALADARRGGGSPSAYRDFASRRILSP